MKAKLLLFFCLIPFGLMLGAGFALKHLAAPIGLEEPEKFEVIYGDSIYSVANNMAERGFVARPELLAWYARFTGMAEQITAGEYLVTKEDSPLTLLEKIIQHNVYFYKVTLIEGWTAKKALNYLHSKEGIAATLDADSLVPFLNGIKGFENYKSIEGWIFPATYRYSKGTTDAQIIRKAVIKMRDELDKYWPKRAKGLPYTDKYQVLTMASIIEKETGQHGERDQIAGVFVTRLKQKMRLQADPTVIYGMGDDYNGNITLSDLRRYTPFNTYKIKGLPPTPIALPGSASIQAALNPLENGMVYFVAKGDGSHTFSKDLDTHNKAVRKYQIERKSNQPYRSKPQ